MVYGMIWKVRLRVDIKSFFFKRFKVKVWIIVKINLFLITSKWIIHLLNMRNEFDRYKKELDHILG